MRQEVHTQDCKKAAKMSVWTNRPAKIRRNPFTLHLMVFARAQNTHRITKASISVTSRDAVINATLAPARQSNTSLLRNHRPAAKDMISAAAPLPLSSMARLQAPSIFEVPLRVLCVLRLWKANPAMICLLRTSRERQLWVEA